MVLLGVAIPICFFDLFHLVRRQRSSAAQAAPHPLIAWCNEPRRYPFLWLGFVAVLFGGAYQIVNEIKRGDADRGATQDYQRTVCHPLVGPFLGRARQALRKNCGGAAHPLPAIMEYCPRRHTL